MDEFFSEVQQQGGTNLDSVKELFSINSEYFKLQTQATFVDLRFFDDHITSCQKWRSNDTGAKIWRRTVTEILLDPHGSNRAR